MKKLFVTLVIVAQTVLVFGQTPVKLKSDNVNMYRQPGTAAEVVRQVSASDEVVVVRKFDSDWSIVTVAGETGYIHNMHLRKSKKVSVTARTAE